MRHYTTGISVLLILAVLTSCASTGKKSSIEPKTIEIQTPKVINIETAYPDGIISETVRNQYDETGTLLKEEQFNGSKLLITQKLFDNKTPDSIEITTLNGTGEIMGKAIREFSGDRLIRERLFNPKGELQSTEEYTYNQKGQKIKWSVKTSSGNEVSSEYVWEKGNLVRVSVLDASAGLIKRFERLYSPSNVLVKENEYDPKGTLLSSIVYVREGNFLVKEETQSPTGAVISSIQYVNDAAGNPIEIKYLDRTGRLLETKSQKWQVFTRTVIK